MSLLQYTLSLEQRNHAQEVEAPQLTIYMIGIATSYHDA